MWPFGGEEKCMQSSGGGELEGGDHLEEVGSWVVVLKINLKGMGLGGNGMIDLVKYGDKK